MYVKRIDLAKLFIGLNPLSFFSVLNQCHVFIFSISIPDLCEEIDNCCKLNSHPENSRILKLGGGRGGGGGLETGPRKYYLRKWRSSMPAGQRRAPLQQFCLAERRERERRAHSGTAICVSPLAIPGAPGYRDGGATFGKRERPLLGNLQRRMVHKLKGARAANFINRERGSHSLRSLFSFPPLSVFFTTLSITYDIALELTGGAWPFLNFISTSVFDFEKPVFGIKFQVHKFLLPDYIFNFFYFALRDDALQI